MKWRNYKPQNFWLGVTWHFPQAIYTNDRKAPLVSRLPHVLRHGSPLPFPGTKEFYVLQLVQVSFFRHHSQIIGAANTGTVSDGF